ncbi:ABC transporter [Sulfurimicrobium lacus]|uniref:ABC transporter n=1 Tax=Sulfurimicrobium lacus TaxID=2715678 RepID=A0A6F8VBY6_9PROT|nr:ABC transporter ATP-binding protein [Sulfurimicrobium lacus]BCB27353.1 ABC transporter [Sulfurimicrobium lacus]
MTEMSELNARLSQTAPIPLDAELSCAPGEVLALVGPSGSGKSTLLRAIAGLYTPHQGRIECGGEVWLDTAAGVNLPTARRRIGMVFQNYALFPHLTVLENVLEGMDDPGSQNSHERARGLLGKVHLDGLESRRPRQLSGGQQQRVAVARALARDPHVLLLDEPFSAVDRATREKLYDELAELRRELNMPVVLVTHDLDEAVMLADRMTILMHGNSLQSGSPLDVMHRPATRESARLVGVKNLFDGEVLSHCPQEGCTVLRWNGREIKVRLQETFPPGARVAWSLPDAGVLLMPRDHAPEGGMDNPVEVVISRLVMLGDRVRVIMNVVGAKDDLLKMVVPRHIAERYALAERQPLTLRLRGEHIHLMSS